MIRKYKHRIIIEIGGHDHFSSLRYHTGSQVLDLPDPKDDFNFHNLILAPSFTPWYQNNPAVSSLEITNALVPRNFRSTYWNLKETIGKTHITPYSQLEFRDLDYRTEYGLDELTPDAIEAFR